MHLPGVNAALNQELEDTVAHNHGEEDSAEAAEGAADALDTLDNLARKVVVVQVGVDAVGIRTQFPSGWGRSLRERHQ